MTKPIETTADERLPLILDDDRLRLIQQQRIMLVLDVGANEGQYATQLRLGGYSGDILSFEPLPDAYASLEVAAQRDPGWRTRNTAAGNTNGVATINVSANSYSSSLLPITPACVDAAPDAAYRGTEQIRIETLDSLDLPHVPILLKADVQGTEPDVLRGASGLLARVALVGVGLSLIPLYTDQLLAHEVCALARGFGFVPVAVGNPFRHPRTGEILSLDAIFQHV